MKSIFEKNAQDEVRQRLERLNAQSAAVWGKMNVAQMLAHCAASMMVPVGDLTIKKTWVRFIGRMFKDMAVNDTPFKKNSPTAAEFLIKDPRDFDTEKKNFLSAFTKICAGPSTIVCFEHSFFGPFTTDDWGRLLYKHTDHHFRQFGV